jgi:hypothetical protein
MRYWLLLLFPMLALSACKGTDGADPESHTVTAVSGQDLILEAGYCRVEVSRLAIGTGTGQLPPGSRLKAEVIGKIANNITPYSQNIRITAKDSSGAAVTGLNLSPAANVFVRFDFSAAARDGHDESELTYVTKSGTTFTNLAHTTVTPVAGSLFTTPTTGNALALMTAFGDCVVAFGTASGGGGGPTPTALTGSISTVLTFTNFALNNTGSTITANLVIPTSDTTGLPKNLTLNDASFDAGNPTLATNRILTVTTGGKTYTTDKAGASVTATLTTFAGVNSSGALVGTLGENSGTGTLTINYTFTTGTAGATALTGTVNDLAGRRTINLQDATSAITVLVIFPDTLPSTPPSSVTFNDSTYDATMPTDPAGRILTVSEAGQNYSSDVPVLGNVTMNFTTFASGVSTGTITGTVVSATPTSKSLNYTFSTTAGTAGGGAGTLVAVAPVDVAATDDALESAIVANGSGYFAMWLSSVGTTNRTIHTRDLDANGAPTGTQGSMEPTAALDAGGGLSAAINAGVIVLCGATGSATSSSVIALVINPVTPSITFTHTLGTGTKPKVVYNPTANLFVVAFTTAAGVSVSTLPAAGGSFAAPVAFHAGATLAGLASAGAADEVLVCANDTSGIRARRVQPSLLVGLGAGSFDVTTSLGAGVCSFDPVFGAYLIAVQEQSGLITQAVMRQLPVGSDTLHATKLNITAITPLTQAAPGSNSALFSDANATFHALKSSATGPAQIGAPLIGIFTGLNEDTTSDGAAIAGGASGVFIALAARGAGNGISAIKLTVTP